MFHEKIMFLMKKSGFSYRWHLESLGLDESGIAKKMDEWERTQENKLELGKEFSISIDELKKTNNSWFNKFD